MDPIVVGIGQVVLGHGPLLGEGLHRPNFQSQVIMWLLAIFYG
jgi:hypothetical protein